MSGGVESRHAVYRAQPLEWQATILQASVSPVQNDFGYQYCPHCQARADECWEVGVASHPLTK